MRHLIWMCGHDLDEDLAQRIGIEILVEERADDFKRCVDAIDREVSDYHPQIAQSIRDT